MNADDEVLKRLLRSAVRPVPDQPPAPDLWPRMSARIHSTRRPWGVWDWAAAAAAAAGAAAFPATLSVIFYAL